MEEFITWLDGFLNFEKSPNRKMFKLDTMRYLLDLLGRPEQSCQLIHIAGSKGKGSTAKLIACVLDEAEQAQVFDTQSRPVGIYASPHMADFRERVSSATGFFADEVYLAAAHELTTTVEKHRDDAGLKYITWFELVTAWAFLCFRQAGCRWAVVEVGMGGRLDATNVIQPALTIITNIELEHTEILGDSLAAIAREKAGIIKPGVPIMIGERASETQPIFAEIAAERGAPIHYADEYEPLANLKLQMAGEIYARNARVATAGLRVLLPELDENLTRRGLEKARLPGRFEIRQNPWGTEAMVMDAAHTVKSIAGTLATFQEIFSGPADLLFALAAGKDATGIVTQFKSANFEKIFVTKPGDFKKSDLPGLKQTLSENKIAVELLDEDFEKVIAAAIQTAARDNRPLLITGSFYLLGEVEKLLAKRREMI